MKDWISADREGLRQIHQRQVEARGYGILAGELYQNVMDTNANHCEFWISLCPGKRQIEVIVTDNGPGFDRLSDAWTLFAPSNKKANPQQAGRFNMGEKLVLSFATEARIETTSGTVAFGPEGRKSYPRRKFTSGTKFRALLRGNEEQYKQITAYMCRIMVRPGLRLYVNGFEIPHRKPFKTFNAKLITEVGDDLSRKLRETTVELYEPFSGEVPMLYELGIPVVETGDKWHCSIGQKVPLNVERDNVEPRYLRSVRVVVFNETHDVLTEDDTETGWVNEAASDPKCSHDAVETFRVKKFGENSLAFDPSNPEANAEAVAHGHIVIPSRGLTPGQRANLYSAGTLTTTSKAFPTAGRGAYSDDPNAPSVEVISDWTPEMQFVCYYTTELARRLMGVDIHVRFVNCKRFVGKRWAACYGRGHATDSFDFNVWVLGKEWFGNYAAEELDKLILHEFGHHYESNHLDHRYHDALTELGARLKAEVLKDPDWFRKALPCR